jgi:hypothetical protein
MVDISKRSVWISWIWANAWAELLGLGATFSLGYGIFASLEEPQTLLAILGFVLLMTATGIIEGTVVGWFQWRVLRRLFAEISLRAWWAATLLGALTAWFLGSLPSSLMGMGSEEAGMAPIEPPLVLILLLACGMGLILGVILALPQWRVLRKHAARAWVWLPANCLAWGLGMALIFAGIDIVQRIGTLAGFLIGMTVTLFITGAVVGSIHGAFLVRMTSTKVSRDPLVSEVASE